MAILFPICGFLARAFTVQNFHNKNSFFNIFQWEKAATYFLFTTHRKCELEPHAINYKSLGQISALVNIDLESIAIVLHGEYLLQKQVDRKWPFSVQVDAIVDKMVFIQTPLKITSMFFEKLGPEIISYLCTSQCYKGGGGGVNNIQKSAPGGGENKFV